MQVIGVLGIVKVKLRLWNCCVEMVIGFASRNASCNGHFKHFLNIFKHVKAILGNFKACSNIDPSCSNRMSSFT